LEIPTEEQIKIQEIAGSDRDAGGGWEGDAKYILVQAMVISHFELYTSSSNLHAGSTFI